MQAALLALGTVIVFPFEMDTIVTLSGGRLTATHYGLYNTICGVGILAGNLLTGSALDVARAAGLRALPLALPRRHRPRLRRRHPHPRRHLAAFQRHYVGVTVDGRTVTGGTMLALVEFDPIVRLVIGPLRVSPHGIGTAVGFLAGLWLFAPVARRHGVDDRVVNRIALRALVGALVGARLAYALNHWGDYSDDPVSVLAVWEGGISLFGGLAGGILGGVPVARRERLPFWPLMDAAAPAIAVGILLGRIGDLVVGDHLGKPTDSAVGFRCTDADTASACAAPLGQGVHMPALYDLVSVAGLLALLLVLRRRPHWDGFLSVVFAAWYGTARFVEDFFRIDDDVAFGLSGSQVTALALAVSAWLWLLAARRAPGWSPSRAAADSGQAGPGPCGQIAAAGDSAQAAD